VTSERTDQRSQARDRVSTWLLASTAAAFGSFVLARVFFDARGLFDRWDCGASDCDTVGLGASYLALGFGLVGLTVGGWASAWRAATVGAVALRLVLWLMLTSFAAWLIGEVWQLPVRRPVQVRARPVRAARRP